MPGYLPLKSGLGPSYMLREHPFNLKGGGLCFFFWVNFLLRFAAQQNFVFATSCRNIIFFLQNNTQSANRIFFYYPFQRQNFFFNQIYRQKSPPPPFKLNGCSLRDKYLYSFIIDNYHSSVELQPTNQIWFTNRFPITSYTI